MTSFDALCNRIAGALAFSGTRRLPLLYAATLLLSALLLFWMQPLYAKMVLPWFGGTPAVWTTVMLFFQVMLLAGYLYAHLLTARLRFAPQVFLHLALIAVVIAALPARLDDSWAPQAAGVPVLSLLHALAGGLGLPIFAISATAPLLQKWFSYTRHDAAVDPYFLYSASNLGCLIALLAYPVLLEPLAGLAQQSVLWTYGYVLLAALILVSAANAWRFRAEPAPAAAQSTLGGVSWRQRALWTLLSFAPASLLLGVTQHITAEIAAVPLLWLVPLTLYVLTFINAFARKPAFRLEWAMKSQPLLVLALALVWILNNYLAVFVLHLVTFTVTALMCHGELARRRPAAAHLTEFYIWLAVGGGLGGLFNVLAPLIFNTILEYPLAIALACMLRPAAHDQGTAARIGDVLWPLALAGAYAAAVALHFHPIAHGPIAIVIYIEIIGIALYLFRARPLRFGLGVAVVLLASPYLHNPEQVLARERSFFGVNTVLRDPAGEFHILMHGITVHGAQFLDPAQRLEPTTYYHRDSPLGQLISALGAGGKLKRIAAVGMGTGTVACYREPGRQFTFYEIDPVVVRLARDTRWFSFLAECAPDAQIIVGDGRLSLKSAADGAYDLIVVDTFSSDSIPVHMITREALALYLHKLAPGGAIIFHITNQYLNLAPVLANLAADAGVAAMVPGPHFALPSGPRFAHMESHWVAMARDARTLAPLASQEGWKSATPQPGARVWTDDYSNLVGALK